MEDDSDLEVGHAMSGPSQEIQSTEWLDQPTGPGWWWYTTIEAFIPEPREVIDTQNGLYAEESKSYGEKYVSRLHGKWSPITPPQ